MVGGGGGSCLCSVDELATDLFTCTIWAYQLCSVCRVSGGKGGGGTLSVLNELLSHSVWGGGGGLSVLSGQVSH